VLGILIELLRDLAVLAAAFGVAWWTWREYTTRGQHLDEAAHAQLASERRGADMLLLAQRIEMQMGAIIGQVSGIAAAAHEADARWSAKIRVHALLQSTQDPFLSFSEIEAALAPPASVEADVAATTKEAGGGPPLSGDGLRRVLIELVGDGVIAQLDRDRYFIATDFEASEPSRSDDETAAPDPA